jgi:4-oxalmesaconate hydratase
VIIDCHGHYTTAPPQHAAWREAQLSAYDAGRPAPPYPAISDNELR